MRSNYLGNNCLMHWGKVIHIPPILSYFDLYDTKYLISFFF